MPTENKISDLTVLAAGDITDTSLVKFGVSKSGTSYQLALSALQDALSGLIVSSGTLTADDPIALTQTWNAGGVTFGGFKVTITDTASAAGSLPLQVLGGAAGATNLFKVDKNGAGTLASSLTLTSGNVVNLVRTVTFSFTLPSDGTVSVPVKVYYSGTIVGWTLIEENASGGSVVVDIWKTSAAVPTVANTIVAAAPPTGTGVTTSTTMTGWTTSVAANDVFKVSVTTSRTASTVVLVLKIQET